MSWVPVTVDYLEADSGTSLGFHALVVCGDRLVGISVESYGLMQICTFDYDLNLLHTSNFGSRDFWGDAVIYNNKIYFPTYDTTPIKLIEYDSETYASSDKASLSSGNPVTMVYRGGYFYIPGYTNTTIDKVSASDFSVTTLTAPYTGASSSCVVDGIIVCYLVNPDSVVTGYTIDSADNIDAFHNSEFDGETLSDDIGVYGTSTITVSEATGKIYIRSTDGIVNIIEGGATSKYYGASVKGPLCFLANYGTDRIDVVHLGGAAYYGGSYITLDFALSANPNEIAFSDEYAFFSCWADPRKIYRVPLLDINLHFPQQTLPMSTISGSHAVSFTDRGELWKDSYSARIGSYDDRYYYYATAFEIANGYDEDELVNLKLKANVYTPSGSASLTFVKLSDYGEGDAYEKSWFSLQSSLQEEEHGLYGDVLTFAATSGTKTVYPSGSALTDLKKVVRDANRLGHSMFWGFGIKTHDATPDYSIVLQDEGEYILSNGGDSIISEAGDYVTLGGTWAPKIYLEVDNPMPLAESAGVSGSYVLTPTINKECDIAVTESTVAKGPSMAEDVTVDTAQVNRSTKNVSEAVLVDDAEDRVIDNAGEYVIDNAGEYVTQYESNPQMTFTKNLATYISHLFALSNQSYRYFSEVVTVADVCVRRFTKTLSESVGTAVTRAFGIAKSLSESVVVGTARMIQFTKHLTTLITAADTRLNTFRKYLTSEINHAVTRAVTLTDQLAEELATTISFYAYDLATLAESVGVSITAATFTATKSLAESVAASIAVAHTFTLNKAEGFATAISFYAYDLAALSESIGIEIADAVKTVQKRMSVLLKSAITHVMQTTKARSETVTTTESRGMQFTKPLSESAVGVAESGYRHPIKHGMETIAHTITKTFTITINKAIAVAVADTKVLKIFNVLKKVKTAVKSRILILGRR